MRITRCLLVWTAVCLVMASAGRAEESPDTLIDGLTFYASFDEGPDADFARGDRRIHTAPSFGDLPAAQPGFLTKQETILVPEAGIGGSGALRFTRRESPVVFFLADKNVPYSRDDWSGTVSVWMRVDPQSELAPGFCDPVQLTTRAWNDASFFVDFNKEGDPRDFRLGVFSDLSHWNPQNEDFDRLPPDRIPMVHVKAPPFSTEHWTHVAFTWAHFNTGQPNGRAAFYLNGEHRGEIAHQSLTLTWKEDEVPRFFLGIYYIGLMDDVACFDRALSAAEVASIHQRERKLQLPVTTR